MAGESFKSYLEYKSRHNNLVVYDVKLECDKENTLLCTAPFMYRRAITSYNTTNGYVYLPDPRIARNVKLLRYEYYWAWSTFYLDASSSGGSRIFLSDLRDVYFQENPFNASFFSPKQLSPTTVAFSSGQKQTTLQVFVEDTHCAFCSIASQRSNARWIRETRGENVLSEIGHNPIGE
jgi:hypothetical protein